MTALIDGSSGFTHTAGSSAESPACGTGSVSAVATTLWATAAPDEPAPDESAPDEPAPEESAPACVVGAAPCRAPPSDEQPASSTAVQSNRAPGTPGRRATPLGDRLRTSRCPMPDILTRKHSRRSFRRLRTPRADDADDEPGPLSPRRAPAPSAARCVPTARRV